MWITYLIVGVSVGGGLITEHLGGGRTAMLLWTGGMGISLFIYGLILLRQGVRSTKMTVRTYTAGRDGGPMAGGAIDGAVPLEEMDNR